VNGKEAQIMRHRTVSDLMTRAVVRTTVDAPFKDIVRLLSEYDVTALPVVDDADRPLGVVSEGDLLHKESGQPDPVGLLADPPSAEARARAAAITAGALMTCPALVARPQWTVVQAARVMEEHQVKRLPVVDETGVLIGIISRSDLLRVFLRHDRAIREEISGDVLSRTLGVSPAEVVVSVIDGRVRLHGCVERRTLIPLMLRLCRSVDGVVEVIDELEYRVDDAPVARSARPPSRRAQLTP
jgi:CBS-domain-containing membrane protein